jgi:hypothetical protein
MDGCSGSDEQLQERRGLGNSQWLQPWRKGCLMDSQTERVQLGGAPKENVLDGSHIQPTINGRMALAGMKGREATQPRGFDHPRRR